MMRLAGFVFAALLVAANADVTDYNDDTFATAKVFHGDERGEIAYKFVEFGRVPKIDGKI
jgi:hypothetical protein